MTVTNKTSKISLLVEGYPRYGFEILSKILDRKRSGVCITRLHPDYVVQKYDLRNVECCWLSGCTGKNVISPKSLNQLVRALRSRMKGTKEMLVFLDGLEYLLMWNDIGRIMWTLSEIDSTLENVSAEMLVCIDPLTLEQRDLERLFGAYPRRIAQEMLASITSSQSQRISGVLQENGGQTVGDLLQSKVLHATP